MNKASADNSAGSPPRPPQEIAWLVLAGWAIPGLGHILFGRRRAGWYLMALVGGAFVLGLILSDFEAVSRSLHPIAFWAQIGVGGGTLPLVLLDPAANHVLQGQNALNSYETVPAGNDSGVLFCCVAGLLNLLVLFDLIDRGLGRRETTGKQPSQAPRAQKGTA